ncbi:hypothetical protein IW261DRAFT_1425369 [Armillaria novae-zelandiae]|uniref:Uncharacterized protein n=1 Tax=Armillaria novae-zelandiae TaxID=153914 RepID=A0AA39NSV4_9AGAR|nr:hypothetical protein IW261DRAFT_1425369 [Armillaria novae-zelandiae]
MSISSFFSSFLPTVHCDSEDKPEETSTPAEEAQQEEEEEEEEPEDVRSPYFLGGRVVNAQSADPPCHPRRMQGIIQEKVSNGDGFKGEECVEELCKYPFAAGLVYADQRVRPPTYSPYDALRRCTSSFYFQSYRLIVPVRNAPRPSSSPSFVRVIRGPQYAREWIVAHTRRVSFDRHKNPMLKLFSQHTDTQISTSPPIKVLNVSLSTGILCSNFYIR